MYWWKANNLTIMGKAWFKIPKFKSFDDKNILNFEEINNHFAKPLILRSSYSIEDGKKHAFAWIFESYFPIYTQMDYATWLERCLNADKNSRFKWYTKINQIDISKIYKNFIIQEFIAWDFSWVCFTRNVDNQIVIEIVPWLNEPLVQWSVKTPFSFVINRNDIKNYNIKNFYMDSNYKTIIDNQVVSKKFDLLQFEEEILLFFKDALIYQFLQIEKLFWYTQDIEFTVKWNDIYILQSRNITIL